MKFIMKNEIAAIIGYGTWWLDVDVKKIFLE